ncbi:MAG: hypothetical protein AMXMBFR64_61140 [Myxococcales bacterium]
MRRLSLAWVALALIACSEDDLTSAGGSDVVDTGPGAEDTATADSGPGAPDTVAPKDTSGPAPVACVKDQPCDDGDPCTRWDACVDGFCKGTAYSCSDGISCTHDLCDGLGGCENPIRGDSCLIDGECYDDGDPAPDVICLACVAPVSLDSWTADDTLACDDGDPCTSGDRCSSGACVSLGSLCDDGNPCTSDSCDPGKGCTHAPLSGPCSDGDPCTTGDACAAGECKAGTGTLECGDGNPCTDDACGAGGCVNTPNTVPCDDGSVCTQGDTCAGGACSAGTAAGCDDGNPCTDEGCDPLLGCQTAVNSAPCDDGNACTVGDQCAGGKCWAGPDPLPCDDGNVCTDDDCDGTFGCFATPNPDPCDDGNACTVGDFCEGGSCQAGLDPLVCDDGNLCTDDTCVPEAGCMATPNTEPCDDASVCTVNDVCGNGGCKGTSISCDDGNECTADSCDPVTGCAHKPIASYECAPNIVITSPKRAVTLDGLPSVAVTGKVTSKGAPIATFTINDKAVTLAADGTFSTTLSPAHGMNIIKAVAIDGIGGTGTAVQSFYFSFEWFPIDAADPVGSYVEDGLEIWLGQKVIDDGDHDPNNVNDLATVFEMLAGGFNIGAMIQNPVTEQGGYKIYVNDIKYGKAKVALKSIAGGLHMTMTIPNLTAKIFADCSAWYCFGIDATGTVTTTSIVIDMDLMLSLQAATGKVNATAQNTVVKINGLDIKLDGVLGFLTNWLINFFEGTFATQLQNAFKDQIANALPPIVASALESLAFNSDFTIPPLLGSGDPVVIQLRTALSTLNFQPPGGELGMYATAVTPKKVPHTVLGSIGRAACLSGQTEPFAFPLDWPLQIGLHDDFFNQILFGIYWGGALSFPVGPELLAGVDLAKYGVSDVSLNIDFLLAPIVTACNPAEQIEIQIGDMHIHAVLTLGGVLLDMDIYVSFAANAEFQLKDGDNGKELGIAIQDITKIEADVIFTDPAVFGFKGVVLGLIQEQLVPAFLDSLAGNALGGFPLPAIDLSGASDQVPPGTTLELDLKQVTRDKGYTLLQGDVK